MTPKPETPRRGLKSALILLATFEFWLVAGIAGLQACKKKIKALPEKTVVAKTTPAIPGPYVFFTGTGLCDPAQVRSVFVTRDRTKLITQFIIPASCKNAFGQNTALGVKLTEKGESEFTAKGLCTPVVAESLTKDMTKLTIGRCEPLQ